MQRAFLDFVLAHYVNLGVERLEQQKNSSRCCDCVTTIPFPMPEPTWARRRKSTEPSQPFKNTYTKISHNLGSDPRLAYDQSSRCMPGGFSLTRVFLFLAALPSIKQGSFRKRGNIKSHPPTEYGLIHGGDISPNSQLNHPRFPISHPSSSATAWAIG